MTLCMTFRGPIARISDHRMLEAEIDSCNPTLIERQCGRLLPQFTRLLHFTNGLREMDPLHIGAPPEL